MQKIVIFEGPDKVGKTEIARELSRRTRVPYFKNRDEVRNFLNPQDYFVNVLRYADPYFLSFLEQTGHSVIIDRHYPSEWVYSRVFGRKTDQSALRRTDETMARLGAKIVVCWRSDYGGKSDDLFPEKIDGDTLKLLHDAYLEFKDWSKCDLLWLNVDDEDLQREVSDVMMSLGILDEEVPPVVKYPYPDVDWSDTVEEVDR